MADKNDGYFYKGYEDKSADYSSYGGTEKETEASRDKTKYVDAASARSTVRNSITLLVSVGLGVILTAVYFITVIRDIVPLINPVLNIVKAAYYIAAFAVIVYYAVMSFVSIKKQNEIRAKNFVLAVGTVLASLIVVILTDIILPPSKLLSGVMLAAAAAFTVYTIIFMAKNSYKIGFAFCIAIFAVLSSFLVMKVFINPIYTPGVDFTTSRFVITSDETINFAEGINAAIIPELKDIGSDPEYSAADEVFPYGGYIGSADELESYISSIGKTSDDDPPAGEEMTALAERVRDIFREETKKYDEAFFEDKSLIIFNNSPKYPNYVVDNYTAGKLYTNFASDLLILDVDQHYPDLNFAVSSSYYNDSVCYIIIEMPKERAEGLKNYVLSSRDKALS